MSAYNNKNQLIQRIQTSYGALDKLISSLSEEQLTRVGDDNAWSIKDNLAHLSAWHQYLIEVMQNDHSQEQQKSLSQEQRQEQNERIYQQNRARAYADVLSEFRATYQEVIRCIQNVSEDNLVKQLNIFSAETLGAIIVHNTYEHYDEHRAMIEQRLVSDERNQRIAGSLS